MPRKSNSKSTKKSTKKRSLWSRAYNAKFSMKDVAKEIWRLKGLVNSEMYKKDTVWATSAITQGSTSLRSDIAQGDGDSDRTGNSIFVRSYNFKGIITRNASGASIQTVRISVIIDGQQQADTNPSYTDIYESASPFAHLNSNTVGRYKVIWTQTYVLDSVNKPFALVNVNLPMRHHVRYNGTSASDVQKGGIYMCFATDESGVNQPSIAGEHRLSYHDN